MTSAIQSRKDEISRLQTEIREIQNECSHPRPAVEREHHADTGNYSEPDYYWTSCHCTLCDKYWDEEGHT